MRLPVITGLQILGLEQLKLTQRLAVENLLGCRLRLLRCLRALLLELLLGLLSWRSLDELCLVRRKFAANVVDLFFDSLLAPPMTFIAGGRR